jgi:putative membrane protein
MATATSFLDEGQVSELEQAIAGVEKQTSAEIVCAVATESGRYDRAEAIFGILFAVLTLVVVNLVVITQGNGPDRWTEFEGVEFTWQMASLLAGFLVGNIIASYWHPVRRLLTRQGEQAAEVARSAAFVFAQQRLASTRSEGGLLIYLSLYERRAVVLADEGVMEATGQPFIDELRDQAVASLRSETAAAAIIETVRAAGDVLSEKMSQSAASPDENELSNRVLLIHPRP